VASLDIRMIEGCSVSTETFFIASVQGAASSKMVGTRNGAGGLNQISGLAIRAVASVPASDKSANNGASSQRM
jgi:hypothetical protein